MTIETPGNFHSRHIGPNKAQQREMLQAIGVPALDALIDQTVPPGIRLSAALDLPAGESEDAYLRRLREIAGRNSVARPYIGMGYYGCVTPGVVLRNGFENRGRYT